MQTINDDNRRQSTGVTRMRCAECKRFARLLPGETKCASCLRALASMAEALAAMAVVFFALWWACKAVFWLFSQVVIHWRTSLTVIAVYLWCIWVGWIWLVLNLGALALILPAWR